MAAQLVSETEPAWSVSVFALASGVNSSEIPASDAAA